MSSFSLLKKTAASLCLIGLPIVSANAATMYFDDFSGDGLSGLNGTTPDTTTGGNTWAASGDWANDGSTTATGTAADDDNAFLAFTPVAGNVYTVSASLATPSGGVSGTQWGAIGFTNTNTLNTVFWDNGTIPWILYRENNEVVSWTGPGIAGNVSEGTFSGPINYSIVLDTTNATNWTAQWLVNGSEVRAATSIGTPMINYVGLGRVGGAAVEFNSFELTVIPEPSTMALLGLGGMVLLRRRRA